MSLPLKEAAVERRQQLAAQILGGEEEMVTQQDAIWPLNERGTSEVAITLTQGKLDVPPPPFRSKQNRVDGHTAAA